MNDQTKHLGHFLLLLVASLSWLFQSSCDHWIEKIWAHLRDDAWWFRLESFEPLLVICSFTIFIGIFNLFDLIVAENGTPALVSQRIGPNGLYRSIWVRFVAWLNNFRVEPHRLPSKRVTKKHFFRVSALKKVVLYLTPILALDFIWPRRALTSEAPS